MTLEMNVLNIFLDSITDEARLSSFPLRAFAEWLGNVCAEGVDRAKKLNANPARAGYPLQQSST